MADISKITVNSTAYDIKDAIARSDLSGKVSGPESSTATHVAIFSDTTGKVIEDSGFTIGTSVPSGAKFTDTNTKVTQTNRTTNATYNVLFSVDTSTTTAKTNSTYKTVNFTYNPGTKALNTNGPINGYTLADASAKEVDDSISDASDSVNLPTSAAVAAFVEGKGYTSNAGTITGITMNGASKGTSGVVDLGTVLTAHQDISGKVSGPASATANHIATYSGTTGKVIQDSGYTIETSVPANAVFTDTVPSYSYDSVNQVLTISYPGDLQRALDRNF